MSTRFNVSRAAIALSLAGLALAGCRPAADQARAPLPPQAAVAKGVVEAGGGLVRVPAPSDGVLRRLLVEEGDHVRAGQPLAAIDDREARLALESAEADLADKRAQLQVARARVAGAGREAARVGDLARADAATGQDADQAAVAASVARGEAAQAAGAVQAAEARRRLAAFEVDTRTIRSPVAGTVIKRVASAGGWTAAAAPLFVIEPDGPRIIRAELDEAFADRVRKGSRAQVTREYDQGRAWPAQVTRVSDVFGAPALADDPAARADSRVEGVVLDLEGGSDLKLGQRVLVRFLP
jgi:RND family efflux transporter MFP subunit